MTTMTAFRKKWAPLMQLQWNALDEATFWKELEAVVEKERRPLLDALRAAHPIIAAYCAGAFPTSLMIAGAKRVQDTVTCVLEKYEKV